MFTELLPYVSYNNLFVLPTYHMLLHGVLKTFWLTALTPGSGVTTVQDRRVISLRGGGVIVTADFSNNYADIVRHAKTWKIHDWHSWVDCWSYFILKDITL